ncbi:Protein of unknown function [Streptomyces sp. Ag109_O5-10]|nr:Protein of unknown function [Streptomyces sp. Ag109_O5-10]
MDEGRDGEGGGYELKSNPRESKGVEMREMYWKMWKLVRRDAGMVTSEYAMGIIAAVGFAAVLYAVVTSGQVSAELQAIVKRALSARM